MMTMPLDSLSVRRAECNASSLCIISCGVRYTFVPGTGASTTVRSVKVSGSA